MSARPVDELQQMVTFAARWAPYGGCASGDIFVEFGISPPEFSIRVVAALSEPGAYDLSEAQRNTVLNQCRRFAHHSNHVLSAHRPPRRTRTDSHSALL
ncbi:hypothetical protein ACFULT_23125 [Rhodococcus sp. NPDC057297]|uniref:hypothetical protein n=1 Tax=Rhodococcus sp. NPDC057297 TaxID=3346090 RepID=UPI00363A1557